MPETYGSTQMRQHVVYVRVGSEQRQRFGENKVGKIAMGVLGMTLVACLVYSAATEQRKYAAYTPSAGLAERQVKQGDLTKMEMQLAAKEVHHKMMLEATMDLSPELQAIAHKLARTPRASMLKAIDCKKRDSYEFLLSAFRALAERISTENATIFAQDAKLYAEYQDAQAAWLDADAKFRSAVIAYQSATESAAYAKDKFDKYAAAKAAGQAEWDSKVPALDAEKAELEAQLPILEQVKTLVQSLAASAAKGKQVQLLKQLPALKKLANAVVPPRFSKDNTMAKQVMALRTSLAETETGETASSMLTILDSIVSTMTARISEIGTTKDMMDQSLKDNIAKFKHWEEQLVDLSDKADKSKNIMDTSDLTRQHLNGIHIVKQEAYEDYHSGFVDQAAKYRKQAKAVAAIAKKVSDAIEACAVPWAKEKEAADQAAAEALAAAQKVAEEKAKEEKLAAEAAAAAQKAAEEKAKADQLAAEAAAAAAKAQAETEAAAKAAAQKAADEAKAKAEAEAAAQAAAKKAADEAAEKARKEQEALDRALAAAEAAKAAEVAAQKAIDDAKKAAQAQCCAGQCSLTSAPLKNNFKKTNPTDRGGGENFYLDRQDVSCYADPMSSFGMKNQGGQLFYEMQCATGAQLDKVETQYSSTEAGGGGNLVFLDRLRVSCTNGGALTSFKLERQGADALRYKLTCATSSKLPDVMTSCSGGETTWTHGPEGNNLQYLDRQNVKCPDNKVLKQFQLQSRGAGSNKELRYIFECCAIAPKLMVGFSCDCGSCPAK